MDAPQIRPQRIKVGTVVVDGRTGMVRLEDVSALPEFQDLRVIVDVLAALTAAYQRQLHESILRQTQPIEAIAEAVKTLGPAVLRSMVEQALDEAVAARQAAAAKGAPARPSVVLAPPGARVRG